MHRRFRHGLGFARIVSLLVLTHAAAPAWAFCGFFAGVSDAGMENSQTQTVIVREFDFTTLTLQFNYSGDPNEFTVVFPVPVVLTDQDVRVVDRGLIERLDTFTAPRAVTYFGGGRRGPGARRRGSDDGASGSAVDDVVRVEAEFVAGEYQIVILSATESTGLFDWLGGEGFMLPDKAVLILGHYIDQGMFFLAARVTLDPQAREDFSFLSPLQMSFETQMFGLPVLMGTINATDEQDLVVYAIARDAEIRTSNYPIERLRLGAQYQPEDWASFNRFVDAQFTRSRLLAGVEPVTRRRPPPPSVPPPPPAVAVIEYVGPVYKGDPPTTDPITWEELRMLGYRGSTFPHITRLHLRYTPDQVPEDLIFYQVPPNFFTPNFIRLPLRGDFDLDDDVDLADYLAIDACLRGAGRFPLFGECYRVDLDQDGDIDLADLLRFQASFTGSR